MSRTNYVDFVVVGQFNLNKWIHLANHLVNNCNVARNRLVLSYGGENETLVPVQGNSYMNRRVEFRVAEPGATDMAAPGGVNTGSNFSGSRDAGY